MGGLEVSPKRRKRDAAKRRRQEREWAAKSGEVVTYIDPSRSRTRISAGRSAAPQPGYGPPTRRSIR
jgi:hypothetical protein